MLLHLVHAQDAGAPVSLGEAVFQRRVRLAFFFVTAVPIIILESEARWELILTPFFKCLSTTTTTVLVRTTVLYDDHHLPTLYEYSIERNNTRTYTRYVL